MTASKPGPSIASLPRANAGAAGNTKLNGPAGAMKTSGGSPVPTYRTVPRSLPGMPNTRVVTSLLPFRLSAPFLTNTYLLLLLAPSAPLLPVSHTHLHHPFLLEGKGVMLTRTDYRIGTLAAGHVVYAFLSPLYVEYRLFVHSSVPLTCTAICSL